MGILDRFKNTPEPEPDRPQGGSGRGHWGGFLQLEELNAALQGRNGLAIFDKMYRTDADVRRSVFMITNPVVSGTWSIEPAGGDRATDRDREVAELVHWVLFDFMRPGLRSHLSEALPVLTRSGFAPFEDIWTRTSYQGRELLVPKTLDLRLPRSIFQWIQDDQGELVQLKQLLPLVGLVDLDSFIYYRVGQEGDNWEGVSLLRPAYKHWYLKDKIERLDAIAQERGAVGIPVFHPPRSGATPEQLNEVEDMLANLRSGEQGYMMFPWPDAQFAKDGNEMGCSFRIEMPAGEKGRDAQPSLEYHSKKIAAAVVADFMMLGQGKVGARATADVQQDPFLAGCEALAGLIEEPLNNDLIPKIVALNFPDVETPPKLSMSLIDSSSLQELGAYVQELISAGALVADPELEDFLRERADLPPADQETRAKVQAAQDAAREAAAKAAQNGGADEPGGGKQPNEEKPEAEPDPKTARAILREGVTAQLFNWVDEHGGLPHKIHELYEDLLEQGHDQQGAVAIAVSQAKKNCARAKGKASEWCDAVAEWERMKAEADAEPNKHARQQRDLRWWEEHMQLDAIENAINDARDQFARGVGQHVRTYAVEVAAKVAAGEQPDSEPPQEMVDAIHGELIALYALGRRTVTDELSSQARGRSITRPFTAASQDPPPSLRQRAMLAAAAITARIVQAARRLALSGRKTHADIQQAAEREAQAALRAEANLNAAPALNEGRSDEADAHTEEIAGARYTSILDGNRCKPCADADDDVLRPLTDPVLVAEKPPNPMCQGGDRCRCMLFYELREEASPSA